MTAIDWAARHLGAPVVEQHELLGGSTSALIALTASNGATGVLRLIINEPWRTHGVALSTRESWTQEQLLDTDVPAPHTIALDPAGELCGHPAHLMTLLPGRTDLSRTDDASLTQMAELLVRIHAVMPDTPARGYQSWAPQVKYVVPSWARQRTVWLSAFELLRAEPPSFEPTFIHRDFSQRNLLWDTGVISGVVDWVETSTGPAWLDVAHCRTNLVLEHDVERGAAFAAAYAGLTGRAAAPYFDVMDVVGFLPTPGRPKPEAVTDPARRRRLEDHLTSVLAQL